MYKLPVVVRCFPIGDGGAMKESGGVRLTSGGDLWRKHRGLWKGIAGKF